MIAAGAVLDLTGYDAVVVGGGLYAGRRHKDAPRFVHRHRRAPAARPLWSFGSGPLDASAAARDTPPVPSVPGGCSVIVRNGRRVADGSRAPSGQASRTLDSEGARTHPRPHVLRGS